MDIPAASTTSDDFTFELAKIPQDPFLPQGLLNRPAFLDTQACLCAYRQTPISDSSAAAWECIGNQTNGIDVYTGGKWFRPTHSAVISRQDVTLGPIWDASNGPDLSTPLVFDREQDDLVTVGDSSLSPYDAACTGVNHTRFSETFYRAVNQRANHETMVDAAPCYRSPYAVPLQIMGLEKWLREGCKEGFLCRNNTVNSLPQYCPPPDVCQISRAAGMTCQIWHENTGMGPFEPVICQGGFYCPRGGMEKFKCPAGHYCPPGTAQPTPCAVGSACPAGSLSQRFYIPLAVLMIFDVCLIVGMLLLTVRKRARRSSGVHPSTAGNIATRPSLRRIMTDRATGYRSVHVDEELSPVSEPGTPRRALTGFEAALAMEQGQRIQDMTDLSPELRSFVQSMQRATDAARLGLSFQYADLSFQPKGMARPILQNVTGSIDRGALTAVMGGSGAGKSTFVNVLMGKTTNTGGVVMVNDAPNKMKRFRKQVGFVPQDDIVLAELTVYENILHSARVRLPRTWEDKDIRAHVDSVIDCLELSHVRDSRVGTVGKPLISGGQRKRVSIGMELAAAPMAIFLDEPTSGLDATAASSIIRTLKAIARIGISVIVIIHQPRMEIFEMLDQLILLANGQIIYEGPEEYVQRYFENCGFIFPRHANSGDVVTDIITGNGRAYKAKGDISRDWLISNWAGSRQHAQIKERHASAVSTLSSSHGRRLSVTPSSLMSLSRISLPIDQHQSLRDPAMLEALKKRGAPRLKQTWLCLRRAMVQQWRDKTSFWFEMALASVAAALLGLAQNSRNGVLFRGIYVGEFSILSNAVDLTSVPQLSLLMGVAIGLISAAPGVRVFSEEMLLHRREAEAGHSRLAYFLAKVLCVLPRMLVACMHFSTITLVLAKPVIPWGFAFVANLGYFWCVYGMSAVISMVAKREDAPLLATMASLIVGILCGAAPTLAQVSKWNMVWLWRMSPGVWLSELYFGELVRPFGYLYQTDMAAAAMGYSLDATWRNIGVLVAIGVVYRVIAYVGLFLGKRIRI
ncbi:hypothetical protein KVR01_005382 [Diaporthe batatas]|uniref:uncharacterized protein n=1 Tax=Diaporthe batatas TaxID=748121 RepID=UPI001D05087B|nr:uncharacterized protein KVR01_005382 [Diaporthe batatas]KAG8165107.1 hypothetical protein KVR01_005382 [Diaporthe batatas]